MRIEVNLLGYLLLLALFVRLIVINFDRRKRQCKFDLPITTSPQQLLCNHEFLIGEELALLPVVTDYELYARR